MIREYTLTMGVLKFFLLSSAMIVLVPYSNHPHAAGLSESQRESDGTMV